MTRPPLRALGLLAVLACAPSARADDGAVVRWRAALSGEDARARLEAAYFSGFKGEHAAALIEATRDKDSDVRKYAATALGDLPPGERPATVVPALVALFSDPNQAVRDHAALALARIGEPAVPALVKVLRERGLDLDAAGPRGRTEVREECAHVALIRIGAPAVPALVALAGSRNDSWALAPAAVALARIGAPAVPALTRGLTDPNRKVRRFAVLVLGTIGRPAAGAADGLAKVARSDDEDLAVEAGRALAALGPVGVAPLLEDAAGTDDARRVLALRSLAQGAPDEGQAGKVAAELARALTDPSERIRYEGARATAALAPRLGNEHKAVVTALAAALGDTNTGTRAEAAAAARDVAAQVGPGAAALVPALTTALGDADERVAEGAAAALGHIGPKAAAASDRLLAAATGAAWRVRSPAATALAKIADPRVVPAALAAAKNSNNYEIRYALASFPAGAVLTELQKALPDARGAPRNDLLALVGQLSRSAADKKPYVEVLRAALADPDSQVAAAAALSNLGAAAEPAAGDLIAAIRKKGPRWTELLYYAGPIARSAKNKEPFVELFRESVKDAGAALTAINALGELGAAAAPAVPELKDALAVKAHASGAARALGQIGPRAKGAADALADRARDKALEQYNRQAAVVALARVAPARGWEVFAATFGPNGSDGYDVIRALALAGPDGVGPLRAALGHESAVVRRAAVLAVSDTPAVAGLVAELIAVADRGPPDVTASAISALGRAGAAARGAGPALVRAAGAPDTRVRTAAVAALGRVETAGGAAALASALADPSAAVRESAARTLLAGPGVPDDRRRLLTAVSRERFARTYLGEHRERGRGVEEFAARLCDEYGGPTFLYPTRRGGTRWGHGAEKKDSTEMMFADEGGSVSGFPTGGFPVAAPGGGGGGGGRSDALPPLTWPFPANFNARAVLARPTIAADDDPLQSVSDRMRATLRSKGFGEARVYRIVNEADQDPNFGFALVTRPEADGAASLDPLDQLAVLSQGQGAGQFRIVAFVVVRERELPPMGGAAVDPGQLDAAVRAGGPTQLPPGLAAQRFGEFHCHVMVFQLERTRDGVVGPAGGGPAVARAALNGLPFVEKK